LSGLNRTVLYDIWTRLTTYWGLKASAIENFTGIDPTRETEQWERNRYSKFAQGYISYIFYSGLEKSSIIQSKGTRWLVGVGQQDDNKAVFIPLKLFHWKSIYYFLIQHPVRIVDCVYAVFGWAWAKLWFSNKIRNRSTSFTLCNLKQKMYQHFKCYFFTNILEPCYLLSFYHFLCIIEIWQL
jgi:hypothetical protein